jgi:hypothetical protein
LIFNNLPCIRHHTWPAQVIIQSLFSPSQLGEPCGRQDVFLYSHRKAVENTPFWDLREDFGHCFAPISGTSMRIFCKYYITPFALTELGDVQCSGT